MWQWQGGETTLVQRATTVGRVLVVEYDDAIRTMLMTVLEVAGYETYGVRNGVDGFAELGRWRPHVVVLDLLTPDMDGFELLARKSDCADLARIPVIVVTTSTAWLPSAERLGVWAVLQRPHDVGQLRELIAGAMAYHGPGDLGDAEGPTSDLLH